jgi:multidrug transporter EmrE-like cation transporter
MATVTLLSAGVFFFQQKPIDALWILFGVSLVNSGAFLLATVTHIEALKHLPTHTVYTIIRLNVVVIVILSILIFNDQLGAIQLVGILFAVGAMVLLTRQVQGDTVVSLKIRKGFVLSLIAVLAGAAASN